MRSGRKNARGAVQKWRDAPLTKKAPYKPYAGKPPVRFCAGGAMKIASLPLRRRKFITLLRSAAACSWGMPRPILRHKLRSRRCGRNCRSWLGGGHALTGTRRDATAALVFGLLAAALLAQNADAQTKPDRWSANYLMPACRNWITFAGDRQGIDEALCAGIISGLAYTVKFLPPDSSSCTPEGVTIGEMVRVVVAYIERRPERMHEDFRKLAVEAWHEAWPCM